MSKTSNVPGTIRYQIQSQREDGTWRSSDVYTTWDAAVYRVEYLKTCGAILRYRIRTIGADDRQWIVL